LDLDLESEKNEEREGKMNLLREFGTVKTQGCEAVGSTKQTPKWQIASSLSYFGQKLVLTY
jgi:hypothetical protein